MHWLIEVQVSPPAASYAVSIYQETRLVHHFPLVGSTSALVLMVTIWFPKRYIACALNRNRAIMAGEVACSLSCIQIIIILFVGSLIFRLWTN